MAHSISRRRFLKQTVAFSALANASFSLAAFPIPGADAKHAFAGHDHDLQHLEFDGHPTSFFLSGAGGADLYNLQRKQSERGSFSSKTFGFSHLEMTPDRITLRYLDENAQVLHAFSKDPIGKVTLIP